MTRFGAHIVQGSKNGYGPFVEARPSVCLFVDQDPAETEQKSGGHTVTIFRADSVYGEAPPGYSDHPDPAALARQWYPALKAKWLLNHADYYQVTNEQGGGEGPDVEGNLTHLIAFEREMMRLANLDGFKVCVLNLAGGSPGDVEIWRRVCLPFIVEAWAGRNIYGRHAYGEGDLVTFGGSVIIGNPSRPFEELGYLRAAGAVGGIAITECGTDAGFGFAGVDRFKAQMSGYEKLLRAYPEFVGLCGWTLGHWAGPGGEETNWQDALPAMTQYLIENPTPKWEWPGGGTPPPVPPPSDDNLLNNGSFENGWWHPGNVPELQIPNEWQFGYYDETTPNPYDPAEWSKFRRPEVRTLPKNQLPPAEWPLFIRDGDYTLKPFGDNKSIYFWLEQTLNLPAGTKRFTPWAFADLVKGYVGGMKVWANDPDGRDGLARVMINGQQVGDWVSLTPGQWNSPAWDFTAAGNVTLRIEFMCPYPLDNAGLFCDGWTLQVLGVEPPPPPPPPPAPAVFRATAWPTSTLRVNQWFAANPENYEPFGLPGHDGTDHRAPTGDPIKAIAAGTVYAVYQEGNYGLQVRIQHSGGHKSVYAHLKQADVQVGQAVTAGQVIGLADSTGNSSGSHLHLTYKRDGQTYTDPAGEAWPNNLFDPWLCFAPLYEDYLTTAGLTGWAWAAGMEKHPHFPAVSWAYGDGVNLNLRRTPDSSQPAMGVIPAGVPFKITGAIQGGYYPVRALLSASPPAGIDIGKYLLPASGDYGRVFTLKNNWSGGQEQVQIQRSGNLSYVVKNSQWERRLIGNDYIDLQLDTSPGDGEYYTVAGHWLPRRMSVGQVYTRTEWVSFKQKGNCQPVPGKPPYASTTQIVFEKHMPTWTSQAGVALNDVVVLAWLVNGNVDERYVFAAGLGLVTWQKHSGQVSWISELLPVGTPNLSREVIPCL